jgi:ribonuclease-3
MAEPRRFPEIESGLRYHFRRPHLLDEALSHGSLKGTDKHRRDNSRLAFLGDAALGLVVAELLFHDGELNKGDMTTGRVKLVANSTLKLVGEHLGLAGALESTVASGPSDPMLATAVEGILGAIYLDAGLGKVADVVREHVIPAAARAPA